ncbi:MAG: alanyl-tRNA editing protein, partial [Thermoplasmata archaeon]|nr:alanyl-tRNA editing protein [Thermoplasmata archaeon]
MTDCLYLTDAYLVQCDATVVGLRDGGVILDRTVCYPEGGGQPSDTGTLTSSDGGVCAISGASKSSEGVVHAVAGTAPPAVGTPVHLAIDWRRRYQHMRYHSCLHLLSGAVFRKFGAGITGGQIY